MQGDVYNYILLSINVYVEFLTRTDMTILAKTKMMIPRMSNTPNMIRAKKYGAKGRLNLSTLRSERHIAECSGVSKQVSE